MDKCQLTDDVCLKESAQKFVPVMTEGIPELNTNKLDVLNLKEIAFELAGLKLNLKEVNFEGLKNSIIDKLRFDFIRNIFCFYSHNFLLTTYS